MKYNNLARFLSFQKQGVFFCLFEFSTKNLATAFFIAPSKIVQNTRKTSPFLDRRFCGPQKSGIFSDDQLTTEAEKVHFALGLGHPWIRGEFPPLFFVFFR